MPQLILASQSKARRRLLKKLGVEFQAISPHIDEDAFKARLQEPRRLVARLAEGKAKKIAEAHPHAFVIGSDQVLVLGRHIFGKPGTAQGAIEQLQMLSGRTARLLTAVCVLAPRDRHRRDRRRGSLSRVAFVDETRLQFRKMTRAEISSYVRRDQPLECAGSFKFEEHGVMLFKRLETEDPNAIEGLPLMRLHLALRKLGFLKSETAR